MPFRRKRRKTRKVSKAVRSYVHRTIKSKAETKFLLLHGDNFTWNASNPLKLDLLGIGQGVDQNQRIGNRIQLTSVSVRLQAITDDTSYVRCFLAWVRDGDLSATVTLGLTSAIDFDQFIIKWDSKKPMELPGMNTDSVWFNRKFLRTKKTIHYDSAVGTSFQGHNLILQLYNGSSSVNIGLNYEVRVFYKDL